MAQLDLRRSIHPLNHSLPLLLVLLLAIGIASPASAQGNEPQGLDYFHTVKAGAALDFRGDLTLPAGFFDEGSPRFAGRVLFQGVPLGKFRGTETGNADTVVARRAMPELGPKFPSRGTAQIELLALSLASARPISIQVGGKAQLWDVKLALSKARPSTGKMEITQSSARGGRFNSEFTVIPVLTFERRGDKAQRTLDVGTMKLAPATEKSLTLRATGAAWSTQAPRLAVVPNARFNPAVLNGGRLVLRHNPKVHVIELAEIPNIPVPGGH